MPAGEQEGSEVMQKASPWGMQESGAGGLQVGARASRRNEWKAPPTAADKAGARCRHGVKQGQGENEGGRRENGRAEPSGVGGNNGGREASGVDPDSHGVRKGEGGHEASEVAENLGGWCHGVGGGVELPQGANTPIVAEGPRGTKPQDPPQRPRTNEGRTDGGRGEGTKTHPPPKHPGGKEPTAVTARREANERRIRPQQLRRRRMMAARAHGQRNPTALTAQGPSTARLRPASMTYWRRRRRREFKTARGLSAERTAMGPWRTKEDQRRRRRGTKPHSTRSLRMNPTEEKPRQGPPPKRSPALNACGCQGGVGGPPTQQHAPTAQSGGTGGPQTQQRGTPPYD